MKLTQVAAQLYTCRDSLKNASAIAATLKRLRQIGYTAVEACCISAILCEEFSRILADNGIVCCSSHEGDFLDAPEQAVDRLRALGCKTAVYAYPHGVDLSSRKRVDEWIARLQRAAEVLARAGQVLCYHNHNLEFRKLDGRLILDLIFEGAPALKAEPDTYWIQYGGGDIAAWCGKLAGRFPVIHLKDYQTTHENKPLWCEIGEGVLDFKSIIAAAEAAGCQWFAVEQDTCPGDPLESLARSFRYVREQLVA